MADPFDISIAQTRLHEQVAERIRQLIFDETIQPGYRLPSERDLSERMGVSRVVIREAMRVLNAQGLLEVKPGSGTYVKALSPHHVSDSISLFLRLRQAKPPYHDLMEIRRNLETEIAGLAAQRATDENIHAMESAIEGMETHQYDPADFTKYDLAFHSALAAATQNELYPMLLTPIADLLLDFRRDAYLIDSREAIEGGLKYHRDILHWVKQGDVQKARVAMEAHLIQAEAAIDANTNQSQDDFR
jgi:DNA-binding FadR family transcriptional regulator